MKSLGLALCLVASPALAADLPLTFMSTPPACTFFVPTIYGDLVCAGIQYGGGSPAGPGAPGTTRVSVSRPTPPSPPPGPPAGGDDCENQAR